MDPKIASSSKTSLASPSTSTTRRRMRWLSCDADDSPYIGVKKDIHGLGLQAVATHDPVVQDVANHAVKTIQQRSNSLVPYELKEIVHGKAEVSEKMDPNELVKLIEIFNPQNKPGRITVITRMGAENMRVKLPHLIRAIHRAGQIVTWVSDPMHKTLKRLLAVSKTCLFDSIRLQVRAT